MVSKFGELLYLLRKEKGMTQMELADRLGITNKAVSKWETGEAFPETGQLVPIADIFNISVDELLRGERNTNNIVEIQEPIKTEPVVLPLKPMTKSESYTTAGAISLILIGAMILITLVLNNISYGIYVSIMIFMTAIGVVLLIITALKRKMRSAELSKEDTLKGKKPAAMLAVSVGVIIVSPISIITLAAYNISEAVFLPIFFAIAIVGITLVILAGIQWGAFSKAFSLPDDEQPLTGKGKRIEEAVSGSIMLLATATFLILGFLFNLWHPGWVVFPVGGILCGIVSSIIKGINK